MAARLTRLAWLLSVLTAAVVVLVIVAFWSEDGRWAGTALVLAVPTVVGWVVLGAQHLSRTAR